MIPPGRRGPEKRKNGSRYPAWILPVAIALIAAVAVPSIVMMHQAAIRSEEARGLISGIEGDVAGERIAGYEAVSGGEVTADISAEVADERDVLAGQLDELRTLLPDDERVGQLREALDAGEAAIDEEMRQVEAGRLEAARSTNEEREAPAFEEFDAILNVMDEEYDNNARRAELIFDVGTIVTACMGAITLIVLFLTYERNRQGRQKVLEESEERFRSLVQDGADLMAILDKDGTVRYASPSVRWMLGYEATEATDGNILGLLQTGEGAGIEDVFGEVLRKPGGKVSAEFRARHADGSWLWLESTLSNMLANPSVGGVVINARDVTERKQAEQELRELGLRNQSILDSAGEGICGMDRQGNFSFVNRAAARMFGREAEVLFGRPMHPLVHHTRIDGEPYPENECPIHASIRDGIRRSAVDEVFWREDGTSFPVEYVATPMRIDGEVVGTVIVFRDVTERRRAEDALRRSEGSLAAAQRIARVGSWEYEINTGELRWSDEAYRILGFSPRQFVPTHELFIKTVHPEDRSVVERAIHEAFRYGRPSVAEYRIVRPDGEERIVRDHREADFDASGEPVKVQGTFQDITERRALEHRLIHQALHDPLTGLPNRRLFVDRIEHAQARSDRRGTFVAVLFLDLDNFKVVNDSLGHEAGDELLVAVAGRLRRCLRVEDTVGRSGVSTIARLGGDEFTILLEDLADASGTTKVAERIARELEAPFVVGEEHEVSVSASIGISLNSPGTAASGEDLLRDADAAMYGAKKKGKARYEIFDASMNAAAHARLKLENDLRRAVEREEFRVYYQPKVILQTGFVVGFEALVRWEHPERGLVLPDEFIPVAEETGLVVPIGHRVLEEACRQVVKWTQSFPEDYPAGTLSISVNLSARQFQQKDLAYDILRVLEKSGLSPGDLILEITESVLMDDALLAVDIMQKLKSLGVRLSIDDFGTGYSSLSYLKRFPADYLKIDRSFVDGLGSDAEDTAIVSAMIQLARDLGLKTVAEGVETADQLIRLRDLGCELAQGYHFAKPLEPAAASRLLGSRFRPMA